MTLELPPTFRLLADTEYGTGLALPIAKAMSHLMIVHEATHREWPLTSKAALAELREAAGHLTGLTAPDSIIQSWQTIRYLRRSNWSARTPAG